MRILYGILCCITVTLGNIQLKAHPPEGDITEELALVVPNQKLIQSFKDMGLTSSELSHYLKHLGSQSEQAPDPQSIHNPLTDQPLQDTASFIQTMQYMREGIGEQFFQDPRLKAAFNAFNKHPREWIDLMVGSAIGGSTAKSWAVVFSADTNVGYFLYPPHTGYLDTNSIGWPVFALVLLPELLFNVNVIGRLQTNSPLAHACEEVSSKTHRTLTWTNRVMTTIFLAKFFKVYYAATWGNISEDGQPNADNANYWLASAYLWSNWWKKYDVLGHKIHLMTHTKSDVLRHHTQSRLAEAYRKLQQGNDEQVLEFAAFVKQLDKNAITSAEKQQSMLAILSYLHDFVDQGSGQGKVDQKGENPYALIEEFRSFGSKPKPTSLKAAEWGGRIFASSVVPFAVLGSYFTWDSVLEILEHRNDTLHFSDKDMKEPDSWIYAIIAATYSGVAGWTSGPVWGRHLWCRYTGEDPNQYREHLEYWPQNFKGLRTIMGGGATYLMSSLLMFPIAGLATEQMYVLGWSMASQKAVLATTAQWGVILDTDFTEPQYQKLITKIGNLSGGDTIGTIKDDALHMIVKMHDGIGKLKQEKLVALHDSLEALTKIRAANMEKFREERDLGPEPDMAKSDETELDQIGKNYLLVSSTSPPNSVQEMQNFVQGTEDQDISTITPLLEPLLRQDSGPENMSPSDRLQPAQPAPGILRRAGHWLWGTTDVSPHLQGLVDQVRS